MRRRVLAAILSVTVIAIVLFGVPLAIIVERFVDEDASLRVERQAVLAARVVPADFATAIDPVELPPAEANLRLALYDRQGHLVTGVGPLTADPATIRALGNQVIDVELPGSRVVAVPVAADEQVIGAIRAEQSTATSDARSRRIVALLAGLAVLVVAVGAMIGWILAGRLTRPVRRLRDAAVRLGDGDFSIEAPRSTVPELDQLAQAMTATSRRLDDLVTRERAFSADVSHQLRTPLAGLRASIETELEFPRPDATNVLHEAISDMDRLERTITELLAIARTPSTPGAAVSLGDVLAEAGSTWRRPFDRAGRSLVVANARYAPAIVGHAAMLRHALDVVLDNALRYGAGEVRVDHVVADETVIVVITDEGPGFGDRLASSASSDLTTTPGSSHGLGLPLAGRLIDAMPGRLMITDRGPHPCIEIFLRRSIPTIP